MYRYFKRVVDVGVGNYIYFWKSKGLHLIIFLILPLDYSGTKTRVRFSGSCLKQGKITYDHGKIVNTSSDPTLENCLFGAVSLPKNANTDRYKYSRYRIGFDRHRSFSVPGTELGRNVIIFSVDMSSLTKIDNSKKYILILGKGPTQGLEHT